MGNEKQDTEGQLNINNGNKGVDKESNNVARSSSNESPSETRKKSSPKQWKSLASDPFEKGVNNNNASYSILKKSTTWDKVKPGQLFSRSESGQGLHVKMNGGRAFSLDTGLALEIPPSERAGFQVYLSITFNSVTGGSS